MGRLGKYLTQNIKITVSLHVPLIISDLHLIMKNKNKLTRHDKPYFQVQEVELHTMYNKQTILLLGKRVFFGIE